MLTIDNHRRDLAGMTYVYPVLSRRAGGVSLGINLNVNNACNWACVYCQVEGLRRGGPPPVALAALENELRVFFDRWRAGAFSAGQGRATDRLVDVAFSGNGEPTSAGEFPAAVTVVRRVMAEENLLGAIPLRLITNGSLLHRPGVQAAIREMAARGTAGKIAGEVWFKVDRAGERQTRLVNGAPCPPDRVLARLRRCAGLAPTWVQTCWFAMDGAPPTGEERNAYCDLLARVANGLQGSDLAGAGLQGVHLYGLARPSQQAMAPRLGRLSADELEDFAAQIRQTTGLPVRVSP